MATLDELLKQKEALERQIEEAKTAGLRETLDGLITTLRKKNIKLSVFKNHLDDYMPKNDKEAIELGYTWKKDDTYYFRKIPGSKELK